MFQEQNNHIESLKQRSIMLRTIREFFYKREVLEVETPLLSLAGTTDPYIDSIKATNSNQELYLQTSPEYAMKRLLAHGSGSIYQICKAFRANETGKLHNIEFTMLEWYRINFDEYQLMQEVDDLLQLILNTPPANKKTYSELFQLYCSINPHQANLEELKLCAKHHTIQVSKETENYMVSDDWLDLLFTKIIEPNLKGPIPWIVYHYPKNQAALAKIETINGQTVARRFEVYVNGIELANGYNELLDWQEHNKRFEHNCNRRKQLGYATIPVDQDFLSAVKIGLPPCSGIALGLDRLLMLKIKAKNIAQTLSIVI